MNLGVLSQAAANGLLFFEFNNNLTNTGSATGVTATFPSVQANQYISTLGITGVNLGSSPKADRVDVALTSDLDLTINFRITISCIFNTLGGIFVLWNTALPDATHESINIAMQNNIVYLDVYARTGGISRSRTATLGTMTTGVLYEIVIERIGGRIYFKLDGTTYLDSTLAITACNLNTTQRIGKNLSNTNRLDGVINYLKVESLSG